MSTIGVKCIDQTLAFTDMPVITTGDKNIDKVKFDFCDLWNGFIKVAVFFQQKGEFSYSIINEDGSCNIPNSILKLTGRIFLAVSGTNKNNQVRTTEIICYTIKDGIADSDINDEFPGEITEEEKKDIYNKMFELVNEMQALCQDLIKNFAYVRIKDGNEFNYDISALQAQINAYTYAKSVIDQKLADLKTSLSGVSSDLGNRVAENTNAINSISATLSSETTALHQGVDTNKASIANLSASVEANTSNISGLSGSLTALSGDLSSFKVSANNTMENLAESISNLTTRVSKLEK